MFKHTLKIFFRDLFRNKIYNLINLFGLSVALASAFLILLFVIHEINFDSFHKNKDNIYRINTSFKWGDETVKMASSSLLTKAYLINDFPEIKFVARVFDGKYWGDGQLVKIRNEYISEEQFKFVDNEFFKIFTCKIDLGNISNLISDKNSLLISEKAALKYFGNENPLGNTLTVKNNFGSIDYTIKAVFKDIPSNSTFQADFIGNCELITPGYADRGWNLSNFQQYLLLDENASHINIEKKMNNFFSKLHPDASYKYFLQNITDLYFNSDDLKWYSLAQGNEKIVTLFSVISLLIIIIASINYMILSTAKGVSRNLEIGMRKVIGASRNGIIKQVLLETFLFIILVFPFALMISELLLPLINHLLSRQMEIRYFENLTYLMGLVGILVVVGFLSAGYISLFLSKFKPEDILKRRFTTKHGKSIFRKVLISIQLIVFVSLFVFSIIIIMQINYVKKSDVGHTTKNLLTLVPPHRHDILNYNTFVESIKSYPTVESISQVASGLFTSTRASRDIINTDDPKDPIKASYFTADYDFIKTFGLKLVYGREFNQENSADANKFILNETAVKELGLESGDGNFISIDNETFEVIGVVKDFHIGSLHCKIPPLIIGLRPDSYFVNNIVVKYTSSEQVGQLINFCKEKWEENGPGGMLDFYFVEDEISHMYDDDKKFGDTIIFFTVLTILIAFLGLFGISLFISKQRNKEAGIHKAFGATLGNIYMLISKEFIMLVVLANVISFPIAYKLAANWLANYSYRINFPIIVPIAVLLISLLFIIIVVGSNAIRVAKQNPTDILRYE